MGNAVAETENVCEPTPGPDKSVKQPWLNTSDRISTGSCPLVVEQMLHGWRGWVKFA